MDSVDLLNSVLSKKQIRDIEKTGQVPLNFFINVGVRLEYENEKIGYNEGLEVAAHYIKDLELKSKILNLKKV